MLWTTGTFDLSVHLPQAEPERVYQHLLTNQHWLHHPLIESWYETAPGEYQIIDRVPMLGFKLRVPYRSKVTALDAHTIRFEGFQNIVYVDNRTSVHPLDADGCEVREQVTVRTLRLLKGFVLSQTIDSHSAMLERLRESFA